MGWALTYEPMETNMSACGRMTRYVEKGSILWQMETAMMGSGKMANAMAKVYPKIPMERNLKGTG